MLSVHSEKPLCLSPHLRSFPALSLKWFHCLSDWWWTFLVLPVKIVTVLLFPPLSPLSRWLVVSQSYSFHPSPGGWWCRSLTLSTPLPSPGGWWCHSLTLSTPLSSPGGWWCRSLTLSTPLPSPGGWWCRSLTLSTPLQVVGGVAVLLFPPPVS